MPPPSPTDGGEEPPAQAVSRVPSRHWGTQGAGGPRALAPCPHAPRCSGRRCAGAHRCLRVSLPVGKEHRRRKVATCISLLVPALPTLPCCSRRCWVWLFNSILFRSLSFTPAFCPATSVGREATAAGLTAGHGGIVHRAWRHRSHGSAEGLRSCLPSPCLFPW